jgi:cytochrome c oxidase subunit II
MIADVALWPEQASTVAVQVDRLLYFLVTLCGSVGLLIAAILIYFCIRYRRRPGETGNPPRSGQSRALEWAWTAIPLVIFVGIFTWGANVYFGAFRAPDHASTIYVVGKQWMWKFQHPEGQREINALHVPVGRPIRLLMTSEDVIHSLFIPDFRIHMDLLPERYTSVWFQATRTGKYHIFCSQYCGTNHAGMTGEVTVMEPADFERWLHSGAEGSLALQGRKTFLKYLCLSCHSADADARAPVLENLFGRPVLLSDGRMVTADEGYLRESILYPSAKIAAGWENIMPTFKGEVDEEDIIGLIAYIQSLKAGETPKRVESYPPPASTPPIEDPDSASPKDR